MAKPCQCDQPNEACKRSGNSMVGRLWELCSGTNCDPEKSEAYRELWDNAKLVEQRIGDCEYLGAVTGDVEECVTCAGRIRLKLFGCEIHGTTTKRNCGTCPDWKEKPNEG